MIYAFLVSVTVVAIYVWQDGWQECPDGKRYTSFKRQPYPFHRRWCGWPQPVLIGTSLASLVLLGTLTGTWKGAMMLMTLPGAWMLATRPTTVDAPAMLAAWCASLAWPTQPYLAVFLSCLAGFIHERAPVYAAIYAWHPLLLVGLVASGWWRKPAPPDADERVGRGLFASFYSHKQDHDWLNWLQSWYALRALPFIGAYYELSVQAWFALALGWGQRLICSDLGRLTFWAGPLMVRELPDVPAWLVLAQAMTFRRMG